MSAVVVFESSPRLKRGFAFQGVQVNAWRAPTVASGGLWRSQKTRPARDQCTLSGLVVCRAQGLQMSVPACAGPLRASSLMRCASDEMRSHEPEWFRNFAWLDNCSVSINKESIRNLQRVPSVILPSALIGLERAERCATPDFGTRR
jgi:hypothetical protein